MKDVQIVDRWRDYKLTSLLSEHFASCTRPKAPSPSNLDASYTIWLVLLGIAVFRSEQRLKQPLDGKFSKLYTCSRPFTTGEWHSLILSISLQPTRGNCSNSRRGVFFGIKQKDGTPLLLSIERWPMLLQVMRQRLQM